jgi:hypothetical protein
MKMIVHRWPGRPGRAEMRDDGRIVKADYVPGAPATARTAISDSNAFPRATMTGVYLSPGISRDPLAQEPCLWCWGWASQSLLSRQDVAAPASNQAPSILRDPSSSYANKP